jgi:hypothetical protein
MAPAASTGAAPLCPYVASRLPSRASSPRASSPRASRLAPHASSPRTSYLTPVRATIRDGAMQRFYRRRSTFNLPTFNPSRLIPSRLIPSRLIPSRQSPRLTLNVQPSTFNPRFACFHSRLPDAIKRGHPRSQVVICQVAERIRKPSVKKMSER